MSAARIAVLPGDGIGPEVTREACRALEAAGARYGFDLEMNEHPDRGRGGPPVPTTRCPPPPARRSPRPTPCCSVPWAILRSTPPRAPSSPRPDCFSSGHFSESIANLRPVAVHPALADRSPLRAERLHGVDLLIVRELTGGLYYGEPRGNDGQSATNTLCYTAAEIERVARVAFHAARGRRGRVLSVDKANVLETSQLWRDSLTRLAREFPDVVLEHIYVDYAAMRLISEPASIDVLVTENMFGDILSDEAAVLVGSLGLLPSASLGLGPGLFEPVHGSAPSIAGQDVANPVGAILSAAMLLRHGLNKASAAAAIEKAVALTIAGGARTRDLARPGDRTLSTREMGDRIVALIRQGESRPVLVS